MRNIFITHNIHILFYIYIHLSFDMSISHDTRGADFLGYMNTIKILLLAVH